MKLPLTPQPGRPFDAVSFGYNSCDYLCLLDRLPGPDAKRPMRRFEKQGGGQAATAAVALARLRLRVRYLGKFGDAGEHRFARDSLTDEGVDIAACPTAPGTQNQLAVVWADQNAGTRTIAYLREPGLEIGPDEFAREDVVAGSVLLLDGHHVAASLQMAHWAREEGIPVLLDAGKNQPGLGELLSSVDAILCDHDFPKSYTGLADPHDALRALHEAHPAAVVAMTLGANGSLALAGGKFFATPAFAVDVVDTTGAGDAWHAGFAAGVLAGLTLPETLRLAGAVAALNCRALGGRAGLPDRAALAAFVAGRG